MWTKTSSDSRSALSIQSSPCSFMRPPSLSIRLEPVPPSARVRRLPKQDAPAIVTTGFQCVWPYSIEGETLNPGFYRPGRHYSSRKATGTYYQVSYLICSTVYYYSSRYAKGVHDRRPLTRAPEHKNDLGEDCIEPGRLEWGPRELDRTATTNTRQREPPSISGDDVENTKVDADRIARNLPVLAKRLREPRKNHEISLRDIVLLLF